MEAAEVGGGTAASHVGSCSIRFQKRCRLCLAANTCHVKEEPKVQRGNEHVPATYPLMCGGVQVIAADGSHIAMRLNSGQRVAHCEYYVECSGIAWLEKSVRDKSGTSFLG